MMLKKKFYLIGIAGVAMASLAGLLKQKGYEVAGSDQEMYEPMAGMLDKLNIPIHSPYKMFHLKHENPDIVVVGNAISRGNPELEYVLSNRLPYRSAAEVLKDEFLLDKCPIVITGTHGKTTTASLVAWVLEYSGLDPTVFVGGFIRNIDSSFKLGKGKYVVIEGDEYDTAFFDKNPKFYHYRPYIGLVNNIELEHVDIYNDLDALKNVFGRFMNLIPQNGLLVSNNENETAKELTKMFHLKHPNILIKTFGLKSGNYKRQNLSDIKTNLIGQHNMSNILGVLAITEFIGIPRSKIKKAIETFEGVKRRAEVILEKNGIVVIDDYAHHPTAVRETLKALNSKFHMKRGNGRLIVAFEPGSASSKRSIFEKEFVEAFSLADITYLYKLFRPSPVVSRVSVRDLAKVEEIFSGPRVAAEVVRRGKQAYYFDEIEKLMFHMKHELNSGDLLVIMACRGFDGLRERISEVI